MHLSKKLFGVLIISLGGALSGCVLDRSTPAPIAALRQQLEQTAAAAKRERADQNAYLAALQAYKEHRAKTPGGQENSLYSEYNDLLAKYTSAITYFWPSSPSDKDPKLPLVIPSNGEVTVDTIKSDYITMADDYRSVMKDYAVGVSRSLPPELPPLPPIAPSDKDARRLINLSKSLAQARDTSLASRPKSRLPPNATWFGPDVPLGGLHTHPGQGGNQPEMCERPIGSGPDGIIMGMMPCN
ncbi:hypothetical protein [Burkholderia gladioli]|uniref:hypothetical protein n=1 Tax=Burkholderia gladioli TaxID=28095 RepID=UPI00163F4951|nr:hypothetical protein [Burkholderia gladioli]MBU9168557.1 hypothetical protein [Burkholderia gladioli]MBU9379366.1 hypothetical protein [Burkholderia gladioli]